MREQDSSPGRLIALEASHSTDLRGGARVLLQTLHAPKGLRGCSFWDASSIFHELSAHAKSTEPPSAKTLLILYAADLAFRLRWEIEPAMADGYTVVAAPYVRTAVNVGKAAGLSSKWLADLFEFAPKPHDSYWLESRHREKAAHLHALAGFPEFCFKHLKRISPQFDRRERLDRHLTLLEKDADAGRLRRLVIPPD